MKESSVSVWVLVWLVLIVLKMVGAIQMGWFAVLTSCIWLPILIILVVIGGGLSLGLVGIIAVGILVGILALFDR